MIDTLTELVKEKGATVVFVWACSFWPIQVKGADNCRAGLIPGQVRHLADLVSLSEAPQLKIPHMGWNHLQLHQPEHAVLAELPARTQVYFVHSFMFQLAQPSDCLATHLTGWTYQL